MAKSAQATITFYGHSTLLVGTEMGKRILIDPWLEGNPACPENLQRPEGIDYMCLTHGHSDHTGSAVDVAKRTGAKVFCIYDLASLLEGDGVSGEQLVGMNKGGTVREADLAFSLTHAQHSSTYIAKDGSSHYAGEACGFVITLESGRTVYVTGDTNLFSDMALVAEEYRPEVLVLPVGDRFTMNPRAAAKAVELVHPRIVIPIHHSTFPLLTGTPEAFRDALGSTEVEVVELAPGASFSF